MTRYVALLRGVNVGGAKIVRAAELIASAEAAGFTGAKTLINSGNLVFAAEGSEAMLASRLHDAIAAATGVRTEVFVRSAEDWTALVAANPFPEELDGTRLILTLLKAQPEPEKLEALRAYAADGERLAPGERAIYAHLPHGQGRSKLAERMTKQPGTARNWNTVGKLQALLQA